MSSPSVTSGNTELRPTHNLAPSEEKTGSRLSVLARSSKMFSWRGKGGSDDVKEDDPMESRNQSQARPPRVLSWGVGKDGLHGLQGHIAEHRGQAAIHDRQDDHVEEGRALSNKIATATPQTHLHPPPPDDDDDDDERHQRHRSYQDDGPDEPHGSDADSESKNSHRQRRQPPSKPSIWSRLRRAAVRRAHRTLDNSDDLEPLRERGATPVPTSV